MFWRDAFLVLLIALMALSLFWPRLRLAWRRRRRVASDLPYAVYTRDFDVEIRADELDAYRALHADPDLAWSTRFPEANPSALFELENEFASRRSRTDLTALPAGASSPGGEAVVSLLIDHSGSMRGQPILFAARAALIASDVLDARRIKLEVLGFTTARWKGGRSCEKWMRDGRPSQPGRLNDLLHIVYCSAGEKLTARDIMPMLRRDLLKENIDGEAIEWAASRLRRYAEPRKCLILLSDGAPVDDSTLLANDGGYLDRHLRAVIGEIENAGDVRLAAIGLRSGVGHLFRHSTLVESPEQLEGALVQLIDQLLCEQS